MRLRALQTFWPVAFIAPLWLLLDRFCWSVPDHVVLHATMLLHENLPAIVAIAGTVSLLVATYGAKPASNLSIAPTFSGGGRGREIGRTSPLEYAAGSHAGGFLFAHYKATARTPHASHA